jgi:hypothetical protein
VSGSALAVGVASGDPDAAGSGHVSFPKVIVDVETTADVDELTIDTVTWSPYEAVRPVKYSYG